MANFLLLPRARRLLWGCALVWVTAAAALLGIDFLPARALAALCLAVLVPGLLAAELLLGPARDSEAQIELGVAGVALGLALCATTMLALAYASGGLSCGALVGVFGGLALLLGAANLWVAKEAGREAADWRLLGTLAAVLALGGALRLTWIGYSEFQGDEARVLLRAGEVLLGYGNVPFIHQKPPGEILLTAALYGLMGRINEGVARLPFALAGLAGLAGALLLGRRLLGNLAGAAAALLLAADGYLVAFGRIVQYQSVVFLCAVVVLLLLAGALHTRVRTAGRLAAVGLLGAGGLLFHYEMAVVALPMLWLLGQVGGARGWRALARAAAPGVALAAGVALLFAVPFVRHPEFARTFAYVAGDRLGGSPPYNTLRDVLERSMLYAGGGFVALQAALAAVGAGLLVARRWGRWAGATGVLALVGAGALALRGQAGWSGLPLAALLAAVPLLPRVRVGERTVWLWFGPLAAAALVLVAVPHSHVYTFFIPLALVSGSTLQGLDRRLRVWPAARVAARVAAAGALIYLAGWPWLLFADAPAERLRRWDEARPTAWWLPFAEPPALAIFGFPIQTGWKAAGLAVARGGPGGGYETNARAEVGDWYTRGVEACPAPARVWLLAETVEPTDDAALAGLQASLGENHTLLGRVRVGGAARMGLYAARDGGPAPALTLVNEDAFGPFEAATATLIEGRRGRIPAPQAETALDVTFADGLRLAGVTMADAPVTAGGALDVTLEWEALRPMAASYTVFLHVVEPATGAKVGQRDSLPVCGRAETWQWSAGDRIADPHRIDIVADAPPGVYRLLMGLYTVADGVRLPTLDANGAPAADVVDLGAVRVE